MQKLRYFPGKGISICREGSHLSHHHYHHHGKWCVTGKFLILHMKVFSALKAWSILFSCVMFYQNFCNTCLAWLPCIQLLRPLKPNMLFDRAGCKLEARDVTVSVMLHELCLWYSVFLRYFSLLLVDLVTFVHWFWPTFHMWDDEVVCMMRVYSKHECNSSSSTYIFLQFMSTTKSLPLFVWCMSEVMLQIADIVHFTGLNATVTSVRQFLD